MTLAQPIWLFGLLLLPLLVIGALLAWRRRAMRSRALVAARLESRLVVGASRTAEWVSLGLLLLGTACIVGALARPQGEAKNTTETIRGRNVIIMLDVSRSMLTADVKPSRLAHAKATAHEMVDALPNDRVGIIAMAGRPFLVAPVTIDHAAVHETISQLDEATIPLGGTDISSAVGMAVKAFKETGQKNNGLIILSDGEDHAEGLKQAAEEARDAGVFIFAVGIGTAQGELVPDPAEPGGVFRDRNGREVLSRLEEGKLRQLATDTDGRYVSSAAGIDIPAMAREAVAGLDEYDIRSATRSIPLEFYQWLLFPGIVLWIASVVVATRWRALAFGAPTAAAAVIVLALLMAGPAQAQAAVAKKLAAPQDTKARDELALRAQRTTGERRAAYHLAAGNEAYKLNDWGAASEAFSAALLTRGPALQASGHYNLGTALFQQGWEQLSGEPPYPGPQRGPAAFEEAIARRFDEWNKVPASAEAPSPTFELLRAVTIFWVDAISHFQAAQRLNDTSTTRDNLALTRHYLQKLRDALEAQNDELEEELPPEQKGQQPEPGNQPGEPQQPGDGQPNNQGDQPQEGAGKEPGDQPPPDGSSEQPDPMGDPGEGGDNPQEQPGAGEQPNQTPGESKNDELDREFQPGESAGDRARRLLGEGSDLERSLVPPGRREFRQPDKDW